MDGLEGLIGEILGSPEKMEMVKNLAGSLLGASDAPPQTSGSDDATPAPLGGAGAAPPPALPTFSAPAAAPEPTGGALPAVLSMLSTGGAGGGLGALANLDPKFIDLAMRVLGALGRDDEKTRLLTALKPHLSRERGEKLDRAMKILRVSGAVRAALGAATGGGEVV